jgi:hypothetical protein
MKTNAPPCPANDFLADHITLLERSHQALTGRSLHPECGLDPVLRARSLYEAPFFLASHDHSAEPVFTYANLFAQDLFEMDWATFTATPSRLTAEAPDRAERARLLERVRVDGFIDDYAGVRVSRSGRKFRIQGATVWNLIDAAGRRVGQAATFGRWTRLG